LDVPDMPVGHRRGQAIGDAMRIQADLLPIGVELDVSSITGAAPRGSGRTRPSPGPGHLRGSSPVSSKTRHTVGVEGTGPITGARCARDRTSLIASPPIHGAELSHSSIAGFGRWTDHTDSLPVAAASPRQRVRGRTPSGAEPGSDRGRPPSARLKTVPSHTDPVQVADGLDAAPDPCPGCT
jgi:hypothetical protein